MNVLQLPFVKTMGICRSDTDSSLELAFKDDVQNHLETIHAGATYALAETASGDAILTNFPELADKVIPLLRESNIKYRNPAVSKIRAFPKISDEEASVFRQQFSTKGRGSITVEVEIIENEGNVTCTGFFKWFLQSVPA